MKASAKGFESYFLEIMAMKKATRVSSPDIPPQTYQRCWWGRLLLLLIVYL